MDTKMKDVRPWGVHTIANMFSSKCSAGLPDGRYVVAVAEPYGFTWKALWWVLTGKAQAVVWPKPGDLENIFSGDK